MKKISICLAFVVTLVIGLTAFTDLPKRFRRMIISQDLAVGQTSTPDGSAALEIESSTKGFLGPRMTTAERNAIGSPVEGLQIWNEDDNTINVYDGSIWTEVSGGGGAGGLANNYYNLLASPETNVTFRFEDDVVSWTGSTTAPTHNTASEIEGEGSLSWDPVGAETLRVTGIIIPDFLHGTNGLIELYYQGGDTDYTLKVLTGALVEIPSECNGTFEVVANPDKGKVSCSFVFPTSGSVVFSLESGSDEPAIVIDMAYVGSNYNVSGGVIITDWQDYTPTGTFTTNTTYTGKWRRVGSNIEGSVKLSFSGAPNATTLTNLSLPSGIVIDTTKYSADKSFGEVTSTNAGSNIFPGEALKAAGNTFQPTFDGGTASGLASITNTSPFSFNSTDAIVLNYSVPVVGWGDGVSVVTENADFGWRDGTCASSWNTNVLISCKYRRTGDSAEIQFKAELSGAPNAVDLTFDLPSEIPVIDTAKLEQPDSNALAVSLGYGLVLDDATAYFTAQPQYEDSNTIGMYALSNNDATFVYVFTGGAQRIDQAVPITFANNDTVTATITVPITGWNTSNRAPQLVNSVVTSLEGVANICAGTMDVGSNTVVDRVGDCADFDTDVGTGDHSITFKTGIFSGVPACAVTPFSAVETRFVSRTGAGMRVQTFTSAGGAQDATWDFVCIGPK